MKIFDGLNNEQIEAVKIINGPVLILAGAGSGKTKTLTHRVAYILSQGINPENILAVTFTNKAANEMQNRVAILLKNSKFEIRNSKLFIGTFHSFGAKILRQEIECLGYKNNFVIYDEDDSFSLAKDIISDLNLSRDRFKPGAFLNLSSKIKSELENPEDVDADDFYKRQFINFYNLYNKRLKAANAVDFDDLIMLPARIFSAKGGSASGGEKTNSILKKYQEQYQYILVDEYQDTNRAQYILINLMAQRNRNLFVIGDPDQAIYGWRHADFRNILNFENDYPKAKIVKLEQNYRSTKNILNAAHEIISKNIERKEKKLWTENPPGALIEVVEVINEREEAEFILDKIIDLNKNFGINFDKIVVIYRTNAQSRVLEEACLYANLPYRVIGAVKFYQRKEVKDILAYLRLIQNQSDEMSLKRIVGIMGKKAFSAKGGPAEGWENLKKEFGKEAVSPAKLIKAVVKKTDYYDYLAKKFPGVGPDGELESESRTKNIKELIGLANKYDNLGDFLTEVALMQEKRNADNAKRLNLMTLHSAKGLEFDAVFIAGVEENLMPHSRSAYSSQELEEERRLCYVGMTRAKKHLWLLFTKQRTLWGEKRETTPSRFIMELPQHLVNFRSLADGYNLSAQTDLPEIKLE